VLHFPDVGEGPPETLGGTRLLLVLLLLPLGLLLLLLLIAFRHPILPRAALSLVAPQVKTSCQTRPCVYHFRLGRFKCS
jgi:hypothetical protein